MNFLGLGALALASAVALNAQVVTPTVQDDKEITITGCVIKGTGGYVLSGATATGAPAVVPPAPATGPTVLYWLDDDDDVEKHVGQKVEVKGKLEDDIDRGEIETEIEGGMVELEFKVKGEKVTVKVPQTSPAAVGTTGVTPTDKPKDVPFLVRTVDVKSVKMIASTCQ